MRSPRLIALAVVTALLATTAVATTVDTANAATSYPTWSDVQQARHSTAATAALVKRIQGDIASLDTAAKNAQAAADRAGDASQQADDAYQGQVLVVQQLASQQKAAQQKAIAAETELGRLVAAQYRSTGGDETMSILLDSGNASDLLNSYGTADKLDQQLDELHQEALRDQQTVTALHDQADAAQRILAKDKAKADSALTAATAASERATAALTAQQSHEADLKALLVVAQQKQSTTYANYEKGVKHRAELAAIARKKQAAGQPSTVVGGWTLPARGAITSAYGWRFIFGAREFHRGTDIGAACGAPEYAAHSGTVTYAGWNGVYGYYIAVDVGGGVEIEYGHIEEGGMLVGVGDSVRAGEVISRAGTTGTSTGCHLFYGVRINGIITNPQPFMSARGVTLGTY